jgi:uncharacterized protein YjbI with pentapeptide repeats
MSNPIPRKRVTVVASEKGIEKAERALVRLGFESKSNFAKSQLVSRNAVTKFFNRDPIQLDTFKRICDGLRLKREEILDPNSTLSLLKQNRSELTEVAEDCVTTTGQQGSVQAITCQVTVVNQQSNEVKATIILKGDITSINDSFKSTLEVLLKSYAGCEIRVMNIQSGSIKITLKGDQQGIERLIEQFVSGELTNLEGFPVDTICLSIEELLEEDENSNYVNNKWEVVQEILRKPKGNRNLQDIDLSEVNLSFANLSFANLSFANLSDADLGDANLRGANLVEVNLSQTNLSSAYLSQANLRGANLSDADFSRAYLVEANLSSAYLSQANLRGANLFRADLNEAYLVETNLSSAYLSSANLRGANLRGANLSSADLNEAYLGETNLRGANLSSANLGGADFRGSDLISTNVLDAYFGEGLGLSDEEKQDLARRGAIFGDVLGRAIRSENKGSRATNHSSIHSER